MAQIYLNKLKKNEVARIIEISDGEENGILVNLGLSVGAELELIWPSILQRPMVLVHGENQLIAIRTEVAKRILVEQIS